MVDVNKKEDIKIITIRPEGQKREYSTYVEVTANPREISLKFCDLKPPSTPDEIELVKRRNQITIPVNTEIALPFDVAESLAEVLRTHINIVKTKMEQEENK